MNKLIVNQLYYFGDVNPEHGGVFRDGCEPVFKFMKAIDWEFTNESNKDCIDKFVRYDYNVWNLIKRYIGVPLNTKIIGA